MKKFIGTKVVTATPMNRQQYNDYRDWPLPDDEDGADEGYLVEYLDGGKPNHPSHTGYISWSPKAQFDAAYRPTDGLTFGLAIEALKRGERVARTGWNGKGMWLALVPADLADKVAFEYAALSALPWIGMKTADENFVPWTPSQSDQLAEDWMILPDLVLEPIDSGKKYYVCVTLDEKSGGWMVTCSAVPELNAVGADVNDALKQAVDALATCKMLYESQGMLLPSPLPASDGELWWISNSGAYGTV